MITAVSSYHNLESLSKKVVTHMNVAIYARVSTAAQAEKGYSLETQVEACRQKAISMGATSIKEYIDDGYSGAYLERPGLDALRDSLSARLHDTVIIYDTDRLARDTMLLLLITEEIEKTAELIYVNSEYSHTPEGQLFYEIKGSFAKYERIRLQDRFNRGRRGKLRSGKPLRDSKILGYDFVDGHYVINESEAELVRHIYQLYLDTVGGYHKLVDILHSEGVLSSTGKRWSKASIHAILTRDNYTGHYYAYRTYRKKTGAKSSKLLHREQNEWIPMECPKIVSDALFDAVQRKLSNNKNKRIRESSYQSLLQGILHCGICGRKMAHARFKGETYYICGANKDKAGQCQNRICKADITDESVWQVIDKICRSEKTIQRYLKSSAKTKNPTEDIQQELFKLTEKRNAVMSWFSQNFISMQECSQQLESIKKKESVLRQKLSSAKEERIVDISSIASDIKDVLTYEDKRRFVTMHIQRIDIIRKGQQHQRGYDFDIHIIF